MTALDSEYDGVATHLLKCSAASDKLYVDVDHERDHCR